jgi:tRNA nucleotidyltransferase/poly(A) polymerase
MASDDRMREEALRIVARLRAGGFRALWAGGCVRDRLLGRPSKDIDVATNARPEQVRALFPRAVLVGAAFGVVRVPIGDGCDIEVATFRRDIGAADGRHPDRVEFTGEEEDARRRDFTVNGLFYDPVEDRVLDYVGGRSDLAQRVIRAIGDPAVRFAEDYLRMLRAVRFAASLAFALDPDTEAAIRVHAGRIRAISAERVRDELTRLLCEAPRAGQGVRLLRRVGLLAEVLPEVAAMEGVAQPPAFHPEGDVLTHTVHMLDAMADPTPELAWAVLLHDVGKPLTASVGPGGQGGRPRIRFDGHDAAGAKAAEAILRRLRMPNRLTDTVVRAVRGHMRFMDVPHMRRASLRRMVGAPTYALERELHRLDCLASHGSLDALETLDRAAAEWRMERALPPPLVDGHAVMAMGVPEGPGVGRRVRAAYEHQLETGETDRAAILDWLRRNVPIADGDG